MKFFFTDVFTLIACVSLNAAGAGKSSIIFESENDVIRCKEYLIVENAKIYGKQEPSKIVSFDLPFLPKQRQKFSTAAIQFGMLTSFSPNSPTK